MKNTLLKVLFIIIIQIFFYLGAVHYLHFSFERAFLNSFLFALFFAALILEAALIQNTAFWMVGLLNLFFILVVFFFLSSAFQPVRKPVSSHHLSRIRQFQNKVLPRYTSEEKKRVERSFYFLTMKEYFRALKLLEPVQNKSLFTRRAYNYILRMQNQFEENLKRARSLIPNFSDMFALYQKKDFTGFINSLRFYRKNPSGKYLYDTANEKMTILSNRKVLEKHLSREIRQFLEEYDHPEIFQHAVLIFPQIRSLYRQRIAQYESRYFFFSDFNGLARNAFQYEKVFTLAAAKKKKMLISVGYLIEPSDVYPLWALDLKLVSEEGEELSIPLAKVTSDYLVFPLADKVESLAFPGIYHKLKNTLSHLKTPMSPSWLTENRKQFPAVYHHIIRPFWKSFARFFCSLLLALGIGYFTVAYIKTLYPRKISPYFYILPFFFLVILSVLFSHLSDRIASLIFEIL